MIEVNGQAVKFDHYPNGESRVDRESIVIDPNTYGRWKVTMRYESDEDLVHLMLLRNVLAQRQPAGAYPWICQVTFSHMPYARMDRAAKGESSFSLREVALFINWLAFDTVTVVDPHSDVSMAMLDRSHEVTVMDALVGRVWTDELALDNTYAVFPDAGAQKKYERFGILFGNPQFLVGLKNRSFSTGDITSLTLLKSDPTTEIVGGSTAIIIDDLCSRGGTFIFTAKALRQTYGIRKVYLVTAHCEESAWKGDLYEYVDHVFTTDSMPENWARIAPDLRGAARPAFITRFSQAELLEEMKGFVRA